MIIFAILPLLVEDCVLTAGQNLIERRAHNNGRIGVSVEGWEINGLGLIIASVIFEDVFDLAVCVDQS